MSKNHISIQKYKILSPHFFSKLKVEEYLGKVSKKKESKFMVFDHFGTYLHSTDPPNITWDWVRGVESGWKGMRGDEKGWDGMKGQIGLN